MLDECASHHNEPEDALTRSPIGKIARLPNALREQVNLRVLNDTQAKAIQEADIDNGEKVELMGHHLFGDKWQGRAIPQPYLANPNAPENSKTQPQG
jgi:hypothetical protein